MGAQAILILSRRPVRAFSSIRHNWRAGERRHEAAGASLSDKALPRKKRNHIHFGMMTACFGDHSTTIP